MTSFCESPPGRFATYNSLFLFEISLEEIGSIIFELFHKAEIELSRIYPHMDSPPKLLVIYDPSSPGLARFVGLYESYIESTDEGTCYVRRRRKEGSLVIVLQRLDEKARNAVAHEMTHYFNYMIGLAGLSVVDEGIAHVFERDINPRIGCRSRDVLLCIFKYTSVILSTYRYSSGSYDDFVYD